MPVSGHRQDTAMFDTGMRFALGDEVEALRETVHRFAQAKIAPRAGDYADCRCARRTG